LKKNAKYFSDKVLEEYDITVPKATYSDVLGDYDPFKLIATRKHDKDNLSPFKVQIESNTLVVIDFHAHLASTEVIGLLGGTYDENTKTILISTVFPCNSISTGVQVIFY
jgi:protein MYSM1